jgi:hypothetical protein
MAAIEGKHSASSAQHRASKGQSASNSQRLTRKQRGQSRKPRRRSKLKKRESVPPSLRFTESKRGKTTVRRYSNRRFYRLEEVKGKTVEFVEVFVAAEYSSINVRFADKTSLHFVVEPGFTLEPEYADLKTGDWRRIKKWPLIRSESHRITG